MHRAIAPGVLMPAVSAGANLIGLVVVAEFNLRLTAAWPVAVGGATEKVEWDTISYQSGFSPALTTDVTDVAIPANAKYCQCVFSSRSGGAEDGFFQNILYRDEVVMARQSSHGSDYLTNSVSAWFEVDGFSNISARMSATNTGDDIDASGGYFAGRFWA